MIIYCNLKEFTRGILKRFNMVSVFALALCLYITFWYGFKMITLLTISPEFCSIYIDLLKVEGWKEVFLSLIDFKHEGQWYRPLTFRVSNFALFNIIDFLDIRMVKLVGFIFIMISAIIPTFIAKRVFKCSNLSSLVIFSLIITHPVYVSIIYEGSGIADPVFTIFINLFLVLFLKMLEFSYQKDKGLKIDLSIRQQLIYSFLCVLFILCALMSNERAVTIFLMTGCVYLIYTYRVIIEVVYKIVKYFLQAALYILNRVSNFLGIKFFETKIWIRINSIWTRITSCGKFLDKNTLARLDSCGKFLDKNVLARLVSYGKLLDVPVIELVKKIITASTIVSFFAFGIFLFYFYVIYPTYSHVSGGDYRVNFVWEFVLRNIYRASQAPLRILFTDDFSVKHYHVHKSDVFNIVAIPFLIATFAYTASVLFGRLKSHRKGFIVIVALFLCSVAIPIYFGGNSWHFYLASIYFSILTGVAIASFIEMVNSKIWQSFLVAVFFGWLYLSSYVILKQELSNDVKLFEYTRTTGGAPYDKVLNSLDYVPSLVFFDITQSHDDGDWQYGAGGNLFKFIYRDPNVFQIPLVDGEVYKPYRKSCKNTRYIKSKTAAFRFKLEDISWEVIPIRDYCKEFR